MTRSLSQSEIDRAGFSTGGAYDQAAIAAQRRGEPQVIQTRAATLAGTADTRSRMLELIGVWRTRFKSATGQSSRQAASLSGEELFCELAMLTNQLLMATEHSASTISMAERAKARNEALAVIGELEAVAGGAGPYRDAFKPPPLPDDTDPHPSPCVICGGPVSWRDVRILNELQRTTRIDGVSTSDAACVACFVPRAAR